MSNSGIIERLEKLGLNRKEAEIYLDLVKNPSTNGSQIAKRIGYPRATIYTGLGKLEAKGYVMSVNEKDVTSYIGIKPKEIFDKYKKDVTSTIDELEKEFEKIEVAPDEKQFYNINTESLLVEKMKSILKEAKKEVYINLDYGIDDLKKIIKDLTKKGVRVIMTSFNKIDAEDLDVEVYCRDNISLETDDKRVLMVVDNRVGIMAGKIGESFSGTYSENKILVNILGEHIHNDIYLMKLEEKYPDDMWKNIKLKTMQELIERVEKVSK